MEIDFSKPINSSFLKKSKPINEPNHQKTRPEVYAIWESNSQITRFF
jgi:hypothetical protein